MFPKGFLASLGIVVTKRRDLQEHIGGEGVRVIVADSRAPAESPGFDYSSFEDLESDDNKTAVPIQNSPGFGL